MELTAAAKGRGLVVCPQPLAAEAGAAMLRKGGNAVDAAVTTAFAQMVVDPFNSGPGGMGQALVWLAPHEQARVAAGARDHAEHAIGLMRDGPVELSFHTRAGRHAREGMWEDLVRGRTQFYGQHLVEGHPNDVGYTSIMVPGTIAGLWTLQRALGRAAWDDCLAPAIAFAYEGFPIRSNIHRFWSVPREAGLILQGGERLRLNAETARLWLNARGELPAVGELHVNRDLGAVLELLAAGGGDAFARGDLAARATSDLRANGSTIDPDDLAEYEPLWDSPLRVRYRGNDVFGIRPPGGGVSVLQILLMLEELDARRLDPWSLEAAELFAFASRAAFRDRDTHVGDPLFVDVPLDDLLGRVHTGELVEEFVTGRPIATPYAYSAAKGDTTHVSVVDADGSAVSLTQTNGSGSGVTSPGLGFMWNNSFYLADPRPGRPNSIRPGKARITGMAPTMLFESGELRMVVGAPGASSIVTGIAQTVRNVVEYGMSATEAVSFPRLHAEGASALVESRFAAELDGRLEAQGLEVVRSPDGHERGGVGIVEAIVVREASGSSAWEQRRLDPGSDPRGDGGVAFSP